MSVSPLRTGRKFEHKITSPAAWKDIRRRGIFLAVFEFEPPFGEKSKSVREKSKGIGIIKLYQRRPLHRNVNPRIDTKKCCCQSGRMAWNQGLSEIRNSPATLSLRPIVADIMTTAQMILTTATEKMTTPQAMVTTAEKNVTTPADNSKISYKHETFYILFKFANSVKVPKAQIRKNGEKQNII